MTMSEDPPKLKLNIDLMIQMNLALLVCPDCGAQLRKTHVISFIAFEEQGYWDCLKCGYEAYLSELGDLTLS